MNNTYGIARVGLTPGVDDSGAQYFPQGYVEAIEAVGAEVVPMMFDIPLDTLYPLVISLDAMVFSGGGDIDPVHYGQARSEACGPADARRDRFELALADLVVGRGIPVLGICRGMQLLNVALGGTLKQNIEGHRLADDGRHGVSLEPGTRIFEIAREARVRVNSHHHQCVDRLADGLRVSARADDGVIEAYEGPPGRFFMGLQWHPEKTLQEPFSQAVFAALRAAMT